MRQSHWVLSISVLPAFLALTNPAFRIYNAPVSTSLLRIITLHPGGDAPSPALSALPRTALRGNLTDKSTFTKQSTPSHTLKSWWKLFVKPLWEQWQQRGYSERLTLVKGNEHPKHPFPSAVNGEDAEPPTLLSSSSGDPLSLHQQQRAHLLWTPFPQTPHRPDAAQAWQK